MKKVVFEVCGEDCSGCHVQVFGFSDEKEAREFVLAGLSVLGKRAQGCFEIILKCEECWDEEPSLPEREGFLPEGWGREGDKFFCSECYPMVSG